MPAIGAAAALVGTGIQIYGDLKTASDQAQLDRDRAAVAIAQSQEIASRELANESIRDQQAYRQKLQFGASYAASGKAGTGVGSQLQIQNQADLQSMISNRESTFQANMLKQQAGIDTSLAEETTSTGFLRALGSGLAGAGRAASIGTSGGSNPGYGGPQGLGAFPEIPSSNNLKMPALGAGRYGGG